MKESDSDNGNSNEKRISWTAALLGTSSSLGSSLSKMLLTSFRVFVLSIREDYPWWMASLWLVYNKRQLLQPNSNYKTSSSTLNDKSSSALLDMMALGSILLLKKAKEHSTCTGTSDVPQSSHILQNGSKESEGEAIRELRRILTAPTTTTTTTTTSGNNIFPPPLPFLPVDSMANQSTQPQQQQQPSKQQQNYVELLVHNVSHTDLILSLDAPTLDTPAVSDEIQPSFCLCRPRFSAFDGYSRRILDYITEEYKNHATAESHSETTLATVIPTNKLIRFPRYERSDDNTKNYQINAEPSKLLDEIPVGFDLTTSSTVSSNYLQVSSTEMKDLRVRGRDAPRVKVAGEQQSTLQLNAVFFPLLASLLPLWQTKMKEKYSFLHSPPSMNGSHEAMDGSLKQVLILVSGVATPRNWTHSPDGNSTYQCARLMKLFLQAIYPQLVVVHIDSGPYRDILRYDENIIFVQKVLLPRIQEYRDAHAKGLPYPDEKGVTENSTSLNVEDDRPFSTEWSKSFSITLSFADGSPARNHAIQAALRTYRPTYYHFWQLKTFWHDSKIVDSDVEVHSFEEMETLPPIETAQLSDDRPEVLQVVEEMQRFRDDMLLILKAEDNMNDIRHFWLRKTQKPVLAVLAVKVPGGGLKLYRGTNMEVSMPTGSLCAERNVIGSALADNPSLKRQDLKMIAVLAVPVPKSSGANEKVSTNSSFARLHSTSSLVSMHTDDNSSHGGARPPLNQSRKSSIGEEEDWVFQDPSTASAATKSPPFAPVPSATLHVPPDLPQEVDNSPSASSTPVRRISLYKSQQQARMHKRTVLVHSDTDINPLRPCGACNEWLKKIAECNPYFTIVTFTDSACNGVYCTPCEE